MGTQWRRRAAALEEAAQRAADLCSMWTADRKFRSAALVCLRPDQLRSHDRHQRIHRSHTHTHTHSAECMCVCVCVLIAAVFQDGRCGRRL